MGFVYGNSMHASLVAIIVPSKDYLDQSWKGATKGSSLDALCKSAELREAVAGELKRLHKESKLHGFERIKKFHLTAEEFTPENGLQTPTFKLKRKAALEKYQAEVDEMYS